MPKFQQDITNYFSDILTRGRDITVRIAVEKGCKINLSDESIEGDTYADWIMDYIKLIPLRELIRCSVIPTKNYTLLTVV